MNSLSHHNLVRNFIPVPEALRIPDAKAAVEKEWGKLEKIPAWQLRKSKTKVRCSFCVIDGCLSSQKFGVGTTISKIQSSSRTSR